jgi:hypothetical protein
METTQEDLQAVAAYLVAYAQERKIDEMVINLDAKANDKHLFMGSWAITVEKIDD